MKGFDRNNLNHRISDHFTYKEALSSIFDKRCLEMNLKDVSRQQLDNALMYAHNFLEPLRKSLNREFKDEFGYEIGIGVTTWIRQKEYEILKERSGLSPHTFGYVADIYPITRNSEHYIKAFTFILNYCMNVCDIEGGFAFSPYRVKQGKLNATGFIHKDFGAKRFWNY